MRERVHAARELPGGRSARPPRLRTHPRRALGLAVAAALLACGDGHEAGAARPQQPGRPSIASRVAELLGRMTLDEKLGQMTLIDKQFLATESDIATYGLGGLCSGGGSPPATNTPAGWADMVDGFQRAALSSRLAIPILYGADAVHGHGDVYGATVFPHNVGLGAARDPQLVQEVARATAEEMAGTGVRWNFAPSVAVSRDARSGRTFESFGEVPEIAEAYATFVTGLQGSRLGGAPASILATAKHWIADGGTTAGAQYGDAPIGDAELRAIHMPPFLAAIRAGVGAIMIGHNSVNGTPMHAHRALVTEVLKGELRFGGLVVSDWNGTGDVGEDYAFAVRSVVNAGIDMVMVPADYATFIATLRDEVNAGRVPMSRIDDAVRRILTKKLELGLFDQPFTDRRFLSSVGSAAHRELARRAVAASLVLLKNDGGILPLARSTRKIFVAGKSADDVGNMAGGWTISWQGSSGDVIPGTTILEAIRDTVGPGATVAYGRDGSGVDASFDVAVAVVGETPYAENVGDLADAPVLDGEDLATLDRLRGSGVPTVVVLVTGRPLLVTDQLPGWRALVVAWLPGSEGQGVVDVLFGDRAPTGKLPLTWPRSASQLPLNVGARPYDPLFPYGFGLTYGALR
ncbi:MAG TPA: glycoside hydrolase family 3 N-terminal domain-containing protein [Anaeromyxobacter sp.]|nr:glycoside hydrolase family 3 N-terminal domain-containing protein [Anaeromyxobacter sp.]